MDEVYFECEICNQQFPAEPSMMMECNTDFYFVDAETGENMIVDDDVKNQALERLQKNPEVSPFMKGAICMCKECQDHLINKSKQFIVEEE